MKTPQWSPQHLVQLHPVAGSSSQEDAIAAISDAIDGVVDESEVLHYTDADIGLLPGYVDVSRFGDAFSGYGTTSRPVLLAMLHFSRPGPTVVLNGHVDVEFVPDEWNWEFDGSWRSGRLTDGVLVGRGSADMLAGTVSIVEVAHRLRHRKDLCGSLHLQFVVDEELGGNGTVFALSRLAERPAVAVICEPTQNRICGATRSFEQFVLTCTGRPVHMAMSGPQNNALLAAAQVLEMVEDLDHWCATRSVAEPTSRYLCVGRLDGGSDAAVPAEVATLFGTAALPAGLPFATFEAELHRRLQATVWVTEDRPRFERSGVGFAGSSLTDQGMIAALRRAADEILGAGPSNPAEFPSACDARLFEQHGIPSVVFGPGDLGWAHRANEHVELAELAAHSDILAAGLASYMSSNAG